MEYSAETRALRAQAERSQKQQQALEAELAALETEHREAERRYQELKAAGSKQRRPWTDLWDRQAKTEAGLPRNEAAQEALIERLRTAKQTADDDEERAEAAKRSEEAAHDAAVWRNFQEACARALLPHVQAIVDFVPQAAEFRGRLVTPGAGDGFPRLNPLGLFTFGIRALGGDAAREHVSLLFSPLVAYGPTREL